MTGVLLGRATSSTSEPSATRMMLPAGENDYLDPMGIGRIDTRAMSLASAGRKVRRIYGKGVSATWGSASISSHVGCTYPAHGQISFSMACPTGYPPNSAAPSQGRT